MDNYSFIIQLFNYMPDSLQWSLLTAGEYIVLQPKRGEICLSDKHALGAQNLSILPATTI